MNDSGATLASPFHDGELEVQRRAGVETRADALGRHGVRPFMPNQHRDFFSELPFLIAGGTDDAGALWASILVGAPGFVGSPDPMTLRINVLPPAGDPLAGALQPGAALGLLGIQLETRRRNRMNGRVTEIVPGGFTVSVDQSFGNCPQYIQAREPTFITDAGAPVAIDEGARLSDRAASLVRASDTFFIASASAATGDEDPRHGVDVSHRGGKPGFVLVSEMAGHTFLTAPDFRGNNMFNTLGNIASNPRCGLLFLDFAGGDLLQLTGEADILFDDPAIARFAGAQRLLRFSVSHGRYVQRALPLRWSAAEFAPQLAKTGSWDDVGG